MIHRVRATLAVGIALLASVGAHAATTFSFTCNAQKSGSFTIVPSSFTFQISKAANPVGGRESFALTIHFPQSKTYSVLLSSLDENENMKTCILTETVGTVVAKDSWVGMSSTAPKGATAKASPAAQGSGEVYQWTFVNANLTSLTATGTDGTGTTPATPAEGTM